MIERLCVESLRNIRFAELELMGGCGLAFGGNGAGKTSLLEAIYLLSRGRSFRGRRWGDVTTLGSDRTRLSAIVKKDDLCGVWRYEQSVQGSRRTLDGKDVGDCVDVYSGLLVRLIGENPQKVLEGEPSLRRRFLDLNLFHVEPGYAHVLGRFAHVLAQRNAWLRGGAGGRCVWDNEFVAVGEALEDMRKRGVKRIGAAFSEIAGNFEGLGDAEVSYREGVPQGLSLSEALIKDSKGERRAGYTRVGPQRGDLVVGKGGVPLVLSRGQQKVVVCLLQLASAAVEQAVGFGRSVWLLDDLGCDLEWGSVEKLVRMFTAGETQCFFTIIGQKCEEMRGLMPPFTSLFHVERGVVSIPS